LPQGGLASRGRKSGQTDHAPRDQRGASQVARKSNEPSGARVVGRLQRSVRSILSPRPRGAERQTKEAVASTVRRALVTEGAVRIGRKGARQKART
jgi:hypothetical protein